MANVLELINGVPRMRAEAGGSAVTIYDEGLNVVASSPGAGEILAVTAGTPITLPSAQTYEDDELEVRLNNVRQEDTLDYAFEGAGPTRTQISFTFDLVVGDRIRFRIDRSA